MNERYYFLLNVSGHQVLVKQQDIHSVENRFSISPNTESGFSIPIAVGYVNMHNNTAAIYHFDQSLMPTNEDCGKQQFVILLKQANGIFGIIGKSITPTANPVQFLPIPEAMKIQTRIFDEYALLNSKVYPVIAPNLLIHYLDYCNNLVVQHSNHVA